VIPVVIVVQARARRSLRQFEKSMSNKLIPHSKLPGYLWVGKGRKQISPTIGKNGESGTAGRKGKGKLFREARVHHRETTL